MKVEPSGGVMSQGPSNGSPGSQWGLSSWHSEGGTASSTEINHSENHSFTKQSSAHPLLCSFPPFISNHVCEKEKGTKRR